MRLERVESGLRWAGVVGLALVEGQAIWSLWQNRHRAVGRTVGLNPPTMRRLWTHVAGSVAEVGLYVWLWRPLRGPLARPARLAALLVGGLLFLPGLALTLWGRWVLGAFHDVSTAVGARLYADHRLVQALPYALVRHPMYLGGLLLSLGLFVLWRSWATLFIALITSVVLFRARREEALLAAEFGPEWQAYCQRTPRWLPRPRWRPARPLVVALIRSVG